MSAFTDSDLLRAFCQALDAFNEGHIGAIPDLLDEDVVLNRIAHRDAAVQGKNNVLEFLDHHIKMNQPKLLTASPTVSDSRSGIVSGDAIWLHDKKAAPQTVSYSFRLSSRDGKWRIANMLATPK